MIHASGANSRHCHTGNTRYDSFPFILFTIMKRTGFHKALWYCFNKEVSRNVQCQLRLVPSSGQSSIFRVFMMTIVESGHSLRQYIQTHTENTLKESERPAQRFWIRLFSRLEQKRIPGCLKLRESDFSYQERKSFRIIWSGKRHLCSMRNLNKCLHIVKLQLNFA